MLGGVARTGPHGGALCPITAAIVTVLFATTLLTVTTPAMGETRGAEQWDDIVKIASDWELFCNDIAVEGDHVYVVGTHRNGTRYDIVFIHYDGDAWQPIQVVNTDVGDVSRRDPVVAAAAGRAHVVWVDYRDSATDADIYYRYFDGAEWGPEEELSNDATSEYQLFPSVAASGDEVHVVWQDAGDGDSDILYRHFEDDSWGDEVFISNDSSTESQGHPKIAVEGDDVHVVWLDNGDGDQDVYHRHFNGKTWLAEEEVSEDSAREAQQIPTLAISNGNIHVAWEYWGDIYHRGFDGSHWGPVVQVGSPTGEGRQTNPDIAAEGEYAFLVWEDFRSLPTTESDVFFRFFNGTDWEQEYEISEDLQDRSQYRQHIAVENGVAHVVWMDSGSGTYDCHYLRGVFDRQPPWSWVAPLDPDTEYWLNITGGPLGWSAGDDYGLAKVDLYYRYSADHSDWSDPKLWATDSGVSGTRTWGNFTFVPPDGDGFYLFFTLATDLHGRQELHPVGADAEGALDTTPPEGTVTIMDGDEWTATREVRLGLTYEDAIADVLMPGPYNSRLKARYSNDGVWDDEPWGQANLTKAWNLTEGDGVKTVYYQLMDIAGLLSPTYEDTIGLDTTPPSGSIALSTGKNYTRSRDVTLKLTYEDETSGVAMMRLSNDGVWDDEPWEGPLAEREWTLSEGDGLKQVHYQMKDGAGWGKGRTLVLTVTLDTTPPTGTIVINDDAGWTDSPNVTLTLTSSDANDVHQARYSNDGVWDDEPWEDPSPTRAWNLTEGEGGKTVYFQVSDVFGWVSETLSDGIFLDTDPPYGSIMIGFGGERTSTTNVTLMLNCADLASGVAHVRFSNDGAWDAEPWEGPCETREWRLIAGDGVKTVFFQIMDNAGRLSETYTVQIILDTTGPTVDDTSPYDGASSADCRDCIEVRFSEAMDRTTVEGAFRLLRGAEEVNGTVRWSADGRTLVFDPSGDLRGGETYRIAINATASDVVGNALGGPFEASFTTEEADVEEEGAAILDWMELLLLLAIVFLLAFFSTLLLRTRGPGGSGDT